MVRAPVVDKDGVKRGAWSLEEDDKLRAYVHKYGPSKWRELPTLAGLTRCGKSCRLRWLNYLRPGLKRGNYTKEENDLICKLHEKHGNRWSTIAAKLRGRTDNEVKNYWNAHLKKQVVKPKVGAAASCVQAKAKQLGPSHVEAKTEEFKEYCSTRFGIVESSCLSQHEQTSSCDENFGIPKCAVVEADYDEISGYGDFWNEAFIWDNRSNVGHVLDGSLQSLSADYGMFTPQHETTYDDYVDLFCSLL